MSTKSYPIVSKSPYATFYYKGTHSHPVLREVLVVESNDRFIRAYELREGTTIRSFKKAPIKSYRRDRIARYKQCRKEVRSRYPEIMQNRTTLKRTSLLEFVKTRV